MRDDTSTVTWWGHATVEIRLDGARLVTDPLLRNRVGPLHSLGHRPSRRDVDALTTVDGVLRHGDNLRVQLTGPLDLAADVPPIDAGRLPLAPGQRLWATVEPTGVSTYPRDA